MKTQSTVPTQSSAVKTHYPIPCALLLVWFTLLLDPASAGAATQPNAWQIADVLASGGTLTYPTHLTDQQHFDATNSGWRFTVISRLVAGSRSNSSQNAAHYLTFGIGTARFRVGWDTNPATQGWLLSSHSTPRCRHQLPRLARHHQRSQRQPSVSFPVFCGTCARTAPNFVT